MHSGAQLGEVIGGVVVHAEHRLTDRIDPPRLGRYLAESISQRLYLIVETLPEHVSFVLELPEEGSTGDVGGGGKVVDGGFVETFLGEEPQRDELELARSGSRRTPTTAPVD